MGTYSLKGSPRLGLTGTTLGFFFGFAAVALYGPTAIKFQETMNLSPFLLGLLVAIPSLSGSLLRIPFGAWVDTTGGKKPFLILLILSVIGLGGTTLLLKLTYPGQMEGLFWLVLVFGFLSGCGIATFSVGIGQTSYWFPQKKQGIALGVYAGMGNLAPGLFSLLLPVYLSYFGFISAYFAWFLFLLIGTVIFGIIGYNSWYFQLRQKGLSDTESRNIAKEQGQEIFPSGNVRDSLINSARVKNTWTLVSLYFTTFGGFIALTAWFPTYWNKYQDFTAVKAGLFTAIFSLLASAVRVLGGRIADRSGGEKVSLISILLVLTGSFILSIAGSSGLGITGAIILAVGMGVNNAAVFKLVPKYVPKAVGGAAGWVGGLGAFGGFVIPPLMGIIADFYGTVGYARGFIVFIVLALLNLVVIYFLMRKNRGKE